MSEISNLHLELTEFVNKHIGLFYTKDRLLKRFNQIGFDYLYNENHLEIMDLNATLFKVK